MALEVNDATIGEISAQLERTLAPQRDVRAPAEEALRGKTKSQFLSKITSFKY